MKLFSAARRPETASHRGRALPKPIRASTPLKIAGIPSNTLMVLRRLLLKNGPGHAETSPAETYLSGGALTALLADRQPEKTVIATCLDTDDVMWRFSNAERIYGSDSKLLIRYGTDWSFQVRSQKTPPAEDIKEFSWAFQRALASPKPSLALDFFQMTGHRFTFLPETLKGVDCIAGKTHQWDVATHCAKACDGGAEISARMAFTGLFHDQGKPETRKVEEGGIVRFPGHAERGAIIAEAVINRLGLPKDWLHFSKTLITNHMFDYFPPGHASRTSDAGVRRLIAQVGKDLIPALIEFRIIDRTAKSSEPPNIQDMIELRAHLRRLEEAVPAAGLQRLSITGKDVALILGIERSPTIGVVLQHLREAIDGERLADEPEALKAEVTRLASSREHLATLIRRHHESAE